MFSSSSSSSNSYSSSSSSSSILKLLSSSSSSSEFPYEYGRLLPFEFTFNKSNKISDIVFGEGKVFVSSWADNTVSYSTNRFEWKSLYNLGSEKPTCLMYQNKHIFVGTSQNGRVVKINLNSLITKTSDHLNSSIVEITRIGQKNYAISQNGIYLLVETESSILLNEIYLFSGSCSHSITDGDKIYISIGNENILVFDGVNVKKATINSFSFTEERKNTKRSQTSVMGVHGGKVLVGLDNRAEIFELNGTKAERIIDNGIGKIRAILSVDNDSFLFSDETTVWLASKIDEEQSSESGGSSSSLSETENSEIKVLNPKTGDSFNNGDIVNIEWEYENASANVKISLKKDGAQYLVLSSRSPNLLSYQWAVPSDLIGDNYSFEISDFDDNSIIGSSGLFSLNISDESVDESVSDRKYNVIPIVILQNEKIDNIVSDTEFGSLMFGTSNGRILSSNYVDIMASGTGNSYIYGKVKSEYGNESTEKALKTTYNLHNYIASIDDQNVEWVQFAKRTTFVNNESIKAYFTSEALDGGDVGVWKEISWGQTLNGAQTNIYIRTADSISDLLNSKWSIGFSDTGATPTKDISDFGLNGRFLQIKVEIISTLNNITGVISHITASKLESHSLLFFTTKYSVNQYTKGFITANVSKPINTEVEFGISNENTNEWDKYQKVTPDMYFEKSGSDIKIGVKMKSYGSNYPTVSEFAVLLDGVKKVIT